jgi:hypothetical protein
MRTYTFGRAFYLMKYGGKICKSTRTSYRIINDTIWEFNDSLNSWVICLHIYSDEVMGSWEEVHQCPKIPAKHS